MADLSKYGADHDDVRAQLPGLTETDASQAIVEAEMYKADNLLQSCLPDKYLQMLTTISGEEIVSRASDGQTTATLGISSATAATVKLYQNFSGLWPDRVPDDELESDYWSVSSQTITFSPGLTEGNWIVAEYDHDGTSLATEYALQAIFLKIASALVAEKVYMEVETNDRMEAFKAMKDEAFAELDDMSRGIVGIPVFDKLTLYAERRTTRAATTFGMKRG